MNNAKKNKYGTAIDRKIQHHKPDNAGSNVQQENSQLPLISHKALQPSDKNTLVKKYQFTDKYKLKLPHTLIIFPSKK